MNKLPAGISSVVGGLWPVTMMILTGGHLSLTAAANFRPSIEPGMLISVIIVWMSVRLSRTVIASSALYVAITSNPACSSSNLKYSLTKNSSSTVKITAILSPDAQYSGTRVIYLRALMFHPIGQGGAAHSNPDNDITCRATRVGDLQGIPLSGRRLTVTAFAHKPAVYGSRSQAAKSRFQSEGLRIPSKAQWLDGFCACWRGNGVSIRITPPRFVHQQ
jgi:hypothetical protein